MECVLPVNGKVFDFTQKAPLPRMFAVMGL